LNLDLIFKQTDQPNRSKPNQTG